MGREEIDKREGREEKNNCEKIFEIRKRREKKRTNTQ